MGYEITVDISGLEKIEARLETAQPLFTERVMQDSNRTVYDGGHLPKDTGALHDSAYMSSQDTIEWPEEYAGYVYEGTSKMPARPWFEITKSEKEPEWCEYVKQYLLGE